MFFLYSTNIQDIEGDDIQRDLQNSTMGVYVINKEGGEIGAHDDIGIYVEGEIILDNIGSVAQACAMMLESSMYWTWLTPKSWNTPMNSFKKCSWKWMEKGFPPKSLD